MNPAADEVAEGAQSHWDSFYRCWRLLRAPLRPDAEVVAAFRDVLGPAAGRSLLLGVTPELAFDDRTLVAIDRSRDMIDHLWPGDTARRTVVHGDWRQTPLPDGAFQAALGDGSLNQLPYPDGYAAVFAELARLLAPGAPFAVRVYFTPQACESVDELAARVWRAEVGSFHAFKFRLAMALAAARRDANIPVTLILETFDRVFPDRQRLVAQTGWAEEDVETIDVYRGSSACYTFPTESELRAAVPPAFSLARMVSSGSYDLAERCPILVLVRQG